jgi:hypothetical protein
MYGLHHQLQGWIDKASGVFRIKIFDKSGGVFDIGKEGSDGFPFTFGSAPGFHGGLLSADALGQVRRRVADGP